MNHTTGGSEFKTPLDRILGTQVAVRVLRVLAGASVPLSRTEIVRQTGAHGSGIPAVLRRLEDAGVIESIGRGRSRPLRIREQFPLAANLRALFRAEAQRAAEIEHNITIALQSLEPRPDSAWIESTDLDSPPSADDVIVVGLLAPSGGKNEWESTLRDRLLSLQTSHDVAIEFRIRWRADIETASEQEMRALQRVRPLLGPPPLDVVGLSEPSPGRVNARSAVSHQIHDDDALRYASIIAKQLDSKPDLIDDAVQFIDRRLHNASASERIALREWKDILTTYSLGRLRALLTSDTQRARRLRQSLPFLTALSPEERSQARHVDS